MRPGLRHCKFCPVTLCDSPVGVRCRRRSWSPRSPATAVPRAKARSRIPAHLSCCRTASHTTRPAMSAGDQAQQWATSWCSPVGSPAQSSSSSSSRHRSRRRRRRKVRTSCPFELARSKLQTYRPSVAPRAPHAPPAIQTGKRTLCALCRMTCLGVRVLDARRISPSPRCERSSLMRACGVEVLGVSIQLAIRIPT